MNKVLLTGASSFLGYHVAKQLNERGIRPRVLELPASSGDALNRLDVERAGGHLGDADAIASACAGMDTLLHLAFKVSVAGGADTIAQMEEINVAGTGRLLDAAAASGIARAVVAGSALAVGVNREPTPLDEDASWSEHGFDFPYAVNRRQAEQEALRRAAPGFAVVVVCPSFTMGPDDPVGAPANKLIQAVAARKMRFTLPVGFGVLDVRDFADAVLRAAERGTSGRRYLISGHNVTANQLLQEAAWAAGVPAPRFQPPKALLTALVRGLEVFSGIKGTPAPVTAGVLQIIGRFAWYDTTRARTDLGWQPRPFRQTVEDTVRWIRAQPAPAAAPARPRQAIKPVLAGGAALLALAWWARGARRRRRLPAAGRAARGQE
jgi:dihydroflavonol-4-reductase